MRIDKDNNMLEVQQRAATGTREEARPPSDPAPRLPIGNYRVCLRATETVLLPAYGGSAWRGVFGHALKRTVCVTREPECARCLLFHSCVYPYIFETPPPPGATRMRLYTAAPHPFVLAAEWGAPRGVEVGEEFALAMRLFGRANQHLPYIVHALEMAGQRGIGRRRGRYELVRLEQESPLGSGAWRAVYAGAGALESLALDEPEPPPPPERVRIAFETPLRLKENGGLCRPEDFAFHLLFRSLLRRVSMLMYFHAPAPLEVDFRALGERSRAVRLVDRELRWRDWTGGAPPPPTAMQMGGLVGRVVVDGAHLGPLWPYIWLGQWTHAGKGTSMGLGRYRVEPASLPGRTAERG